MASGLLTELGFKQEKNVLHNDSQSAIHLARIRHFILDLSILDFIITSSLFRALTNLVYKKICLISSTEGWSTKTKLLSGMHMCIMYKLG